MGKHFIANEPQTPAEDLRKMLEKAESLVANLRSAGPEAIELLRLLDRSAIALEELESIGVDVRPERIRFETVQRRLSRYKRRLVAGVGDSLEKERAIIQPARERWWWYLDETLAEERRKRLRRVLLWVAAVIVLVAALGVIYESFLAPPPEVRLAYRHNLAGEEQVRKGDLEGALDEFEAAMALMPDEAEYHLWVGVLRAKLNEPGAEAAFEAARSMYSSSADFFLERARVYRTAGDYEAALADVDQAIAAMPDSGWAYYERAQIHQGMGDLSAAIEDLDRADELAGEAGDARLQAFARYQRGLLMMSPPLASTPTE
jgi:tetratricopeptide (TPR) repeat protein